MDVGFDDICDFEEDYDDESLVEVDDEDDVNDEEIDDVCEEDGVEVDEEDANNDGECSARNIAVLSDEEREYIIDMVFNRGVSANQLSEEIGCTKEAIYGVSRAFRAINRHRTMGDKATSATATVTASVNARASTPTNEAGKAPVSRMYNQQEEEVLLKKFVRANNVTSVKELQDFIDGKSDLFPGIRSLSKRTLYRILKRCRSDDDTTTTKSDQTVADSRVLQERLKYVHEMTRLEKLNSAKIVYVDISGYKLTVDNRIVPSSIEEPNSRGGPLSMCMAISEQGILHARFKQKPFSSDQFVEFLRELVRKLSKGRHVFVLESTPVNRLAAVQECIRRSGNLAKYLPKSSTFLNPLKTAFTVIGAGVHLNTSDTDESSSTILPRDLLTRLVASRLSITVEQSLAWIVNTRSHYDKCLKNDPIGLIVESNGVAEQLVEESS